MKIFITYSFLLLFINFCFGQSAITAKVGVKSFNDLTLKINLRGVYESKITLLPLTGTNALKPIVGKSGIKNGETTILSVSNAQLPGEFVLRFDYKEKETGTPYPCEKHIFVNEQNIELWVNPMYCNNNDSSYFQKDEKENTVFARFTKENGKQKEKLGLLQNFLMNYDDTQSQFYKQGTEEYQKRRNNYNHWLKEQATLHKALFVSHTFGFQYLPQIVFNGSETARQQSVIAHYFDGIDFNDTLLLHTNELKNFITAYVNIYASLAKTQADLDSLYPLIGKTAIEKARLGNPKLYGWMVDYFYNGYESTNMPAGIKMLEPYINDTACLTTKRQAIEKRLKGIKTLTIGTLAPDFMLKDDAGNDVLFSKYKSVRHCEGGTARPEFISGTEAISAKYKLLLFWSADCSHCKELVGKLYTWYNQQPVNTPNGASYPLVEVFALSLDESETEIPIWQNAITQLPGWKHIRCEGGINSPEANAYFILSTPVMFLIDNKTNKICAIPENTDKLKQYLDEISKK